MTGGVWYKMLISIRTWSRVVYRPSHKTADHWQQARSIIKSLLRLSYFYQFDYNTLPCNMTHRYRGTNYPHNHTTLHRTLRAFCCIIIAMILAASQHSQKTSISLDTALKSPTPIIASSSGQVSSNVVAFCAETYQTVSQYSHASVSFHQPPTCPWRHPLNATTTI